MIFGKIDYLNLLPFYIFLQKRVPKISIFRKGVPSNINKAFHSRKVDLAFISSVTSKKSQCSDLGIIARDEVLSVLILSGKFKKDSASETSNRLAEILEIKGEVVIGDKALSLYFNSSQTVIDLALEWKKKYNLPFVFAKLCFHKNNSFIRRLEKKFRQEKVYIPHYIMERESKRVQISKKRIKFYLSKIDYKCDQKSRKGLNKFLYYR